MKTTNETRRRVMKMAHVRRRTDKIMFGEANGDFAYYLREAWATVKSEQATTIEEPKTTTYHPELLQIPADYYGVRGAYYGD